MKAAVIGASGLIGGHIADALINSAFTDEIVLLVRKDLDFTSPKVHQLKVDFQNETSFREALSGVDVVFCAIGTTQAKVKGDLVAYRKVDYDIPVNAAKFAASQGCTHFLLVSSVGADANASNFYLKIKGEVEAAVLSTSIPIISIFRPSMLLGQRNEFRLGERIGQALMKGLSFLIPSKYKAIEAKAVAGAMVAAAGQFKQPSKNMLEYKEMVSLLANRTGDSVQ